MSQVVTITAAHAAHGGHRPFHSPQNKNRNTLDADGDRAKAAILIQRSWRKVRQQKGLPRTGSALVAQVADIELNRKRLIRAQVREICIYVIFLLVFSWSAIVAMQDQTFFHMSNFIKDQIVEQEFNQADSFIKKTLEDVATVKEFHQWLRGPFFTTVYTDNTWPSAQDKLTGTIYGVSYILGAPRISQIRVKRRTCSSIHAFQEGVDMVCVGDSKLGFYSEDTEEKEPFGTDGYTFNWEGDTDRMYMSVEDERGQIFSARRTWHANFFPPGAYGVVLSHSNATDAMLKLQAIEKGNYLDIQTRAVTVEFVAYSPMLDYFHQFAVIGEMGPGGGVLISVIRDTLRLYSFVESSTSSFLWILEIIVVLFYLYFFIVEILKGKRNGWRYFASVGVVMHNMNLILYMLVWFFRIASVMSLPPAEDIKVTADVFYTMQSGVTLKAMAVYLNAMNAFLCWFKLVTYLAYAPRFALVTRTFQRAASSISGFLIIFVVVFYGFAAAHMMTFGTKLAGFRNLTQSTYSLLSALLGDFDFGELQRAQWLFGPLFFILFVAVAVFVVLNVLIAIISDAYSAERDLLENRSVDLDLASEMADYILFSIERVPLLGKLVKKSRRKGKKLMHTLSRRAKVLGKSMHGGSNKSTDKNTAVNAGNANDSASSRRLSYAADPAMNTSRYNLTLKESPIRQASPVPAAKVTPAPPNNGAGVGIAGGRAPLPGIPGTATEVPDLVGTFVSQADIKAV